MARPKDSPAKPPPPAGTLKSPPVVSGSKKPLLIGGALLAVVAGIAIWFFIPKAPPVLGFTVVKEYPHDKTIYCQGLVYDDGILFESAGKPGQSSLRRVKLETAETIERKGVDSELFAEGITLWQDKVIQLTWQARTAIVYKKSDFTRLTTFKYEGEGWGLTNDGKRLIRSDGTDRLIFHDPETFKELGSIHVTAGGKPVRKLNELEYISGEIWANVYQTDRIAMIDPESGKVNAFIDLAGIIDARAAGLKPDDQVLNGIAHDPATGRIFVTGKDWPKLFEIKVVPKR